MHNKLLKIKDSYSVIKEHNEGEFLGLNFTHNHPPLLN